MKSKFMCSHCGYISSKWSGKCLGCGQWDTLEPFEEGEKTVSGNGMLSPAIAKSLSTVDGGKSSKRLSTQMEEVDRVLGGGIVSGEVILLSGEPGIGKSTLLSQICLNLSSSKNVLYVSGEESLSQIAKRFQRLERSSSSVTSVKGLAGESGKPSKVDNLDNLIFTEETDVDRVVALIDKEKPDIVIVDSIQSLSSTDSKSFVGSMTQVRNCGTKLSRVAKANSVPIIIVGQVTKEGIVAGPKILEHIVDAVLYFEGDEVGFFRILRGIKNRFGPTDEVGIFEMTGAGLVELKDPSGAFCRLREKLQPGVALSAVYKGSRIIFVEIQALTAPAVFGSARRVSTGFNKSRLEMLCAVLSRRTSINLSEEDVFVNVMGGLRLDDPSADLAICMAIASAKRDKAVGAKNVYIGEVGLSGLVYPVFFAENVKKEGKRRNLEVLGVGVQEERSLNDFVKAI